MHEIEEDYREELAAFQAAWGEEHVAPLLEKEANVAAAFTLFDGDLERPLRDTYHYMDSLLQAQFESARTLDRVEIHWRNRVPNRPVRLELQTSTDMPRCWTSVVNDDRAWEFSTVRVGGTLLGARLPGDEVTTLYFPPRKAKAARLLLSGVPDEITEIRFLGAD